MIDPNLKFDQKLSEMSQLNSLLQDKKLATQDTVQAILDRLNSSHPKFDLENRNLAFNDISQLLP